MAMNTVLSQIGLSDKQTAVYLAALELGRSPVMRIAHKANIKRPTAYVVLEELQQMGLVEVTPRGDTKFYQAVDPAILVRQLNQKAELVERALPELRAILNTKENKPKVRFFEGKRAIYDLYSNEILQQAEIFSLVNLNEFARTFSKDEMTLLLDQMKDSGIKAKELIDNSENAKWYLKEKSKRGDLGQTKTLPKKFKFDVDFVIFESTVVMVSLKNLVAVVIEDVAISRAQLQILEFLYESI